ncbi:MAG: NADP-dependent oxidoreductase [Tannerellaceae bacterium]|nr:NADP-dependent oxidoreductase [Tannerellaceae bacterium]
MKAIIVHSYGTEDVLKYEDTPVGKRKNKQVLVKVMATSVNHLEVIMISGKAKESMPIHFPWIPGFEGAGIVEEADFAETGFKKGDQVYFHCNGGSYAEYILIESKELVAKPENISFTKAACIPHTGLTAWQALFTHGQLQSGQKVLIHGGAGAVGSFAVQFAKHKGATVYTTASKEDQAYVESLQADYVIDYKTVDFTKVTKDMDLVLVLTGDDTLERSYQVLKPGGRLVATTGQVNQELADKYRIKAKNMVVYSDREQLEQIKELVEGDLVKVDLGIIYSLSEAPTAWKTYAGKTKDASTFTHGKVVLEM